MNSPPTEANFDPEQAVQTSYQPLQTTAQEPKQNTDIRLRSCMTCRRRKVKCDRKLPCNNCKRVNFACHFPAPKRPASQHYGGGEDLIEQLKTIVQKLGRQTNESDIARLLESRHSTQHTATTSTDSDAMVITSDDAPSQMQPVQHGDRPSMSVAGSSTDGLLSPTSDNTNRRNGRMVKEDGRYRYINDSFWTTVNHIHETEGTDEERKLNEELHTPSTEASVAPSALTGYLFCPLPSNTNIQHPPPSHVRKLWTLYKQRFDPVVKILHLPTMEPRILSVVNSTARPSGSFELLLLAIYYAAVTSVNDEVCMDEFNASRQSLLSQYRQSFDTICLTTRLTESNDLPVLQALTIFLTVLRRHDAHASWLLTGLVVRVAQYSGIHRDGTLLKLSTFETELRRRIWWALLALDGPSSEDFACDPTLLEMRSDTELPRNINDVDLTPDMMDPPQDRAAFTEMTFTRVRAEIAQMWRTLLDSRGHAGRYDKCFEALTTSEKEQWVSDCESRFEHEYLQYCRNSEPLPWATITLTRLIFSKIRLAIYNPLTSNVRLTPSEREQLFARCVQNIEYSYRLRTDGRSMSWSWLFNCHVQWHSLAFVLKELNISPLGHDTERAWRAVEQTLILRWDSPAESMRGSRQQWNLILLMADRARSAREAALRQKRSGLKSNGHEKSPSTNRDSTEVQSTRPRLDQGEHHPPSSRNLWDNNPMSSQAQPSNVSYSLETVNRRGPLDSLAGPTSPEDIQAPSHAMASKNNGSTPRFQSMSLPYGSQLSMNSAMGYPFSSQWNFPISGGFDPFSSLVDLELSALPDISANSDVDGLGYNFR